MNIKDPFSLIGKVYHTYDSISDSYIAWIYMYLDDNNSTYGYQTLIIHSNVEADYWVFDSLNDFYASVLCDSWKEGLPCV